MEHDIEIKLTEDGSHTIFNKSLNENYHSWHGAQTESEYVYIQRGLEPVLNLKNNINLLEVGLGTGLNAILTLKHIWNNNNFNVHYTGIEKFPLENSIIKQLNYVNRINEELKPVFEKIHLSPWNENVRLAQNFEFIKHQSGIENIQLDKSFDLVYFDAFAPNKQPEIWSKDILKIIFDHMNHEGIFVTYCAQGIFKRNLGDIGYHVETLVGPPGKREMTRAIKR